jgi:hypothetical protein
MTVTGAPAGWLQTGDMRVARRAHAAALLEDGRVLVAGGLGPETREAEVFDPAAGCFISAGYARVHHGQYLTATTLRDGKVLVVGGDNAPDRAEIFDPQTRTFADAGPPSAGRFGHTATLLRDGRVLIAGGQREVDGSLESLASSEIYDPATNTFQPARDLNQARGSHGAAMLPDGRVLVIGGGIASGPVATRGAELLVIEH